MLAIVLFLTLSTYLESIVSDLMSVRQTVDCLTLAISSFFQVGHLKGFYLAKPLVPVRRAEPIV